MAALRDIFSWFLWDNNEALAFVGEESSLGAGTRAGKSIAESEGAGEDVEGVTRPRLTEMKLHQWMLDVGRPYQGEGRE